MPTLHVVPHTHWDREWYLSFERFQERLVVVFEQVLDLIGREEGWTHFHLDGQTAVYEDFLELRPERRSEIAAHISSGRFSCGPWVTLVDEFLVSGESIIRNLEDGLERAARLGAALRVGYLPDQFGHVGQMPQILNSLGIHEAVVWRGVPASVSGDGFLWESPDGSEVEVAYLRHGYGQGSNLPEDEAAFIGRIAEERSKLEAVAADDEPLLLMAGDDHAPPNPKLPQLIEGARAAGADVSLSSLADYLSARSRPKERVHGELRSAARANLLPNTYSSRALQKLERARAELLLERYAEPLAALVPGFEGTTGDLRAAWELLHLNGAHDSVCGCSTDEVARAVDERTGASAGITRRVAEAALDSLAGAMSADGVLVFNPSPWERDGVPALGWKVLDTPPQAEPELPVRAVGERLIFEVAGTEIALSFEDQHDVGDLYTFCPDGESRGPSSVEVRDGLAYVYFEGCDVIISARPGPGFLRVATQIDNRAPDHRLRVHVALDEAASTSTAGAPFEIVRRPRLGEGGDSEPPSPCWPARGFAIAGGRGYLHEGVFEYELLEQELALTLLRCTGTISRPHALATRRSPAGPDVATPGAQMLGPRTVGFGVLVGDPGEHILRIWERYALPLMMVEIVGGGDLPPEGSLLEIIAPALSSVRSRPGGLQVRLWNPWDRPAPAVVGDARLTLAPHRIETVDLPR